MMNGRISKPRYTVILPLYNKEAVIERALLSVKAQSVNPLEVIVVNDNSSDGSLAVVERLAETWEEISILNRSTPGPGGYAARNHGARRASGDWLLFLDADDYWLPEHIETIDRVLAELTSQPKVIFTSRCVVRPEGMKNLAPRRSGIYVTSELLGEYVLWNCFHFNSFAVRKDFFLSQGGLRQGRGWKKGGDSELWLRLILSREPFYLSDRVTNVYDMSQSDIVSNPKNIQGEHPVFQLVCSVQNELSPTERALVRKVSNRKVIASLRGMSLLGLRQKLPLLRTLFWLSLSPRQVAAVIKQLLRP